MSPNIPQFVSKGKFTTEAPAVMQRAEKVTQPIDGNFGQSRLGEQIGQQISELGEKMIKVENFNAKSKSDIETTQAMLAYEDRVSKDPDPDNALKDYDTYMSKTRESAAKNFKNRAAREEYIQKFELENVVFKNKLQSVVMKKQVDIGRTNVLTSLDLESSNYINAQTEAEKLGSRQKMDAIITDAVQTGFFDHEDGYKLVESTIKSADESIKDNKALAKRKEKELVLAQKEAKSIREQDFIKMRVTGKDNDGVPISREELIKAARDDMEKDIIEPKFAEIYINALKSPKSIGKKTENAKFVGFVNDMLFNKTKPKDITIALMEANTAGSLSDEDFNTLISFNKDANESGILNKMVPNISFLKGAMYWGDENAGARDDSKVRMFNDFKLQVEQGVSPEIASKQSIRNEVLFLFPQAKTAPKEGIDILDLNGVIKHITPDGELTIKEKKAK